MARIIGADVEFKAPIGGDGGVATDGAGAAEADVARGAALVTVDDQRAGTDGGGAGVGVVAGEHEHARAVFCQVAGAIAVGDDSGHHRVVVCRIRVVENAHGAVVSQFDVVLKGHDAVGGGGVEEQDGLVVESASCRVPEEGGISLKVDVERTAEG